MIVKLLRLVLIFLILFVQCCKDEITSVALSEGDTYITVLGIAQDAGFPQINCEKECCKAFYNGTEPTRLVSSLGLVDVQDNKKFIFDATPDFKVQSQLLKNKLNNGTIADGIFLTHAHMGHYIGLLQLGFEAMNAEHIPVYAMPRMKRYLESNGPWNQLVTLNNIEIRPLKEDSTISISSNLKIVPFFVPHRDEYSETVGYKIIGPNRSALFIPDINKWELWEKRIVEEVKKVDFAFLDGTFFKNDEIDRPMEDVPHPFIEETISLFNNETRETKQKVIFIHFNHSNLAILKTHNLKDSVINLGFKFAKEGQIFDL